MKSSAPSARSIAVNAVTLVLRGAKLDVALEQVRAQAAKIDVPTVHSLSYGAVRGYFRYEAILTQLLSQPVESLDGLPRALMCVALFEIEDAVTPHYAVVDAAVETARALGLTKLGGLVNAVLRRYLRERASIDAKIAANPVLRHAFPQWLAENLRSDWPIRWTQLMAAGDRQAPMWLRVNALRSSGSAYLETLLAAGIDARPIAGLPQALMLSSPCDVQQLPGFDAGLVSIQDLGAQCATFPLDLRPGQCVLDACAAPGGKSALIAEQQPDLARLVAVDIDAARLQRVRETIVRTGIRADCMVGDAAAPGTWWDGKPFDRVLLDVPCSALGVIRRHPDIRLRRRPDDIDRFAATQSALLAACWKLLAPGGRLVYATCTLTRRENHDVIAVFLRSTPAAAVVAPSDWTGWPKMGESDGLGCQILPGEAGADGFYYAALTKQ